MKIPATKIDPIEIPTQADVPPPPAEPAIRPATPQIEKTPAPIEAIVHSPVLTGNRGRIATAYKDSLQSIRQAGPQTDPRTTLREDIKTLGPLPPGTERQLAELTALVEAALYSTEEPDAGTAARAEKLAQDIRSRLPN